MFCIANGGKHYPLKCAPQPGLVHKATMGSYTHSPFFPILSFAFPFPQFHFSFLLFLYHSAANSRTPLVLPRVHSLLYFITLLTSLFPLLSSFLLVSSPLNLSCNFLFQVFSPLISPFHFLISFLLPCQLFCTVKHFSESVEMLSNSASFSS